MVSLPSPPFSVSLPPSPDSVSVVTPPVMVSSPAPPVRVLGVYVAPVMTVPMDMVNVCAAVVSVPSLTV